MADFKKFSRPGGFNARPYNKNSSGPKELFDAECNSCRQRCQVPFRPNGKKPVYCTNCFSKNDSNNDRGTSTYSRDSRDSRFSHDAGPRPQRSFTTEVPDRQLQGLKREIETMNKTLQGLVTAVDTFNRATALTLEIQKHFPEEKAEKKSVAKKVVAKKTAAKKAAKK